MMQEKGTQYDNLSGDILPPFIGILGVFIFMYFMN